MPGEVTLEVDKTVKPVIQRARRDPLSFRDDLRKELERLEREKIVFRECMSTEWITNLLLIRKKDGELRICIDPVPLNAALLRPRFQFTTLDEILPEIGKARVFSTIDAKKGFWQLKLTEPSSRLMSFWTPFGRYRWLRLPFGVSPAPEIFSQKMMEVISGLKGVEVLVDDILVYGCGDTMPEAIEDHNMNLKSLLVRLEKMNCKLKRQKVKLCQESVKFFGHVLTSDGVLAI